MTHELKINLIGDLASIIQDRLSSYPTNFSQKDDILIQ